MYDLVKILHIGSLIVWMSGMIITPFLIILTLELSQPSRPPYIHHLRRLFKYMTTPAMILTWVFGLLLAAWQGWFGATWLNGKLFLVVLLSGMHGFLSGRLRRLQSDNSYTPSPRLWLLTPLQIIIILVIISLVTAKPE